MSFPLKGFLQQDSRFLLRHPLVFGVFSSPVGPIILSDSSRNGLLNSLQNCLVEGLDFGVQVLLFVVDFLHELINQF